MTGCDGYYGPMMGGGCNNMMDLGYGYGFGGMFMGILFVIIIFIVVFCSFGAPDEKGGRKRGKRLSIFLKNDTLKEKSQRKNMRE